MPSVRLKVQHLLSTRLHASNWRKLSSEGPSIFAAGIKVTTILAATAIRKPATPGKGSDLHKSSPSPRKPVIPGEL